MSQTHTVAITTGPELTARSIVVGLAVALVIGSAYPYCVLKLGFGPNLSVVSAFFGFIALVLILRAAGTNPRETIIVLHEGRDKGASAGPVRALGLGSLASGVLMILTSFLKLFPDTWFLPGMQPMNIGLNWSLLSFGSGLLVGFRICLAMAIGT